MQRQSHESPLKKILRHHTYEDTSILHHCKITKEEIAGFATGLVEKLDEKLFYAFLCQLSTFIPKSILVFSPFYEFELQENGEPKFRVDYGGNKKDFTIAIIPVKVTDYYGIAIYEKGASIHYFDPLYNAITPATRQYLRTITLSIVDDDTIVKVYQVKNALFNKATTIDETTILCCIIVERYLMHSKRTYIDNFNIHQERDIITQVLKTILTGEKLYLDETNFEEVGSHKSWELRRKRAEESNEERENRLKRDNERKHFSLEEEEDSEKEMRLSSRRNSYQNACESKRSSIYLQGRQTDDNLQEHCLNSMDVECVNCGALHFLEEATQRTKNSFNDCCRFPYILLYI
jgi:hypothetical protein